MENDKFNKTLNEKYFLMKDIARKYNYSEELLNMITFIYLAFYMTLGKRSEYALHDLFNRVKIIYEKGTVGEIAVRNGYDPVPDGAAAVTLFTPNFEVFNDPTLKQKPQVIILGTHVGDYLATPALKLEMLVHEFRHALTGYYNTNKLLDKNTYYMRSGMNETIYHRNDNIKEKLTAEVIGLTIDEVTNTYISSMLVNRISSLKKFKIQNPSLYNYLSSLKTKQQDGLYRSIGYKLEVKLLYPLLLVDNFLNTVDYHEFDGEIELVKEYIETYTALSDYREFSDLLDQIHKGNSQYEKEAKEGNEEFVHDHIANINNAKKIILDLKQNIVSNNRPR